MMQQVKREADGYSGAKRFKGTMDSSGGDLRLLIPSKCAGPIIGKSGENVKRLRADYKASVTIPDSTAPERIVVITADIDNMCEVATEVLKKMEEHRANTGPDETDLKVLVHKSQAGAVIGRAGFKIKELRDLTNTNIKVFPETCPMSTDRIVNIGGTKENQVKALKEVLLLLQETNVKGMVQNYDTMNYDPSHVYEYGGFPPDRSWRPTNPGAMGGGNFSVPGAMGGGYGGGAMYGGAVAGPMVGRGGFGPGAAAAGPIGMMPNAASNGMGYTGGAVQPQQTAQVTIPKDLAGTIIGKGGERIKQIKDQSGAHVVVEKLEPDAEDRIITITGSPQCIQMAQYLLQQCVRSSAVGRKYIQDQQIRH